MLSKIYSVKSNAARAAKAYGLGRDDLQAVSGGWQFELPPSDGAIYAAVAEKAAEAADVPPLPESLVIVADEPTDEELKSYYADVTVPNGVSLLGDAKTPNEVFNPPATVAAKAPRQRRAKAAKSAKAPTKAKAPVKAKAPRKARAVEDGPTKRGTKAYADKMAARRRAGMNKRGITELVLKEIRTRWTPTSELLKMTGWQPTTLRGVLSLYAKRHNIEIKGRSVNGQREYLVAR